MMGAGIAYAQASKRHRHRAEGRQPEKAEAGKAYSVKITQPRVDKGRMDAARPAQLLDRIPPTDSVQALPAATSSSRRCSRTAS